MRISWILAACLCAPVAGCAIETTQRDRDISQCAYGVVVPRNIKQSERQHYINEVAVPACLKAKGYPDDVAGG